MASAETPFRCDPHDSMWLRDPPQFLPPGFISTLLLKIFSLKATYFSTIFGKNVLRKVHWESNLASKLTTVRII